jgi:hypothetical protein
MLTRALLALVCLTWLAAPAVAQEPGAAATVVMRSGERLTAEVIDISAPGYLVRVNGAERYLNPGDIAVIEFTRNVNPSRPILSGLASGQQYIVLRNGQVVEGRLSDIGGRIPKILYVTTPSGLREFSSNDVAVVYLASPPGAAPRAGQADGTMGRMTRTVSVPANQQWTETDIIVREGETLMLRADGQIFFGANERASAAGVPRGTRGAETPMPSAPAGALVGRVDDGLPFMIGGQTSVRMPASGRLYLGINDDVVSDNSGEFQVTIAGARR